MGLYEVILGGSTSTYILVLLGLLVLYSYLNSGHGRTLPPGPPAVPILGSLPFLGDTDPRKAMAKLRKKYGDLFTVRLGSETAVVLNGYELIREALVTKAATMSGRPNSYLIQSVGRGKGIAFTQGEVWRKNRDGMLRCMRAFGYGKKHMEEIIQREIQRIIVFINSQTDKPIMMRQKLMQTTCNAISVMCFNKVFDHDDKDFHGFLEEVHVIAEFFGHWVNFFPWLRHLPGDIGGFKKANDVIDRLLHYCEVQIEDRKSRLKEGEEPIDVVGSFLVEMSKKKEKEEAAYFNESELTHNVFALYAGGTDSSAVTLSWAFLYMVRYPEIQEKVYAEINAAIGASRQPGLADRDVLHYTQACIMETQRCCDMGPLGAPHAPTEDTELRGYTIPKGMMVMPVQNSIHHDPELWPNPKQFDPTRFLDENGKFVPSPKVISFSMGPRICFGEVVAKAELFLLFSTLIQHFKFSRPKGAPEPELEGTLSIMHMPKDYGMTVTER